LLQKYCYILTIFDTVTFTLNSRTKLLINCQTKTISNKSFSTGNCEFFLFHLVSASLRNGSQRAGGCLRAGLRATSLSHETKAEAGEKSSITHFSPLAGRTQVGHCYSFISIHFGLSIEYELSCNSIL
jgi:hypothetical protein